MDGWAVEGSDSMDGLKNGKPGEQAGISERVSATAFSWVCVQRHGRVEMCEVEHKVCKPGGMREIVQRKKEAFLWMQRKQ